jgi:hypothetical protein
VPGDGLAFTVFVSREIEFAGIFEQSAQFPHLCFFVVGDDIDWLKALIDVHTQAGPGLILDLGGDFRGRGWQIPDVSDRRFDLKIRAEILPDRAGLGR